MGLMSRRTVLTAGAAGIAAMASQGGALAAPLGLPVGLELYPLNAELAKDFEGTLQKVAQIGYREVELPTFYGHKPSELKAILSKVGLNSISGGVLPNPLAPGMPSLETHVDELCRDFNELGLTYMVSLLPPTPKEKWTPEAAAQPNPMDWVFSKYTTDDWRRAAEFLNAAGEKVKAHGLQLLHHNHDMEFSRVGEGVGYDVLLKETDPSVVNFELDCAFPTARGYDAAEYIRKHATRIKLLHIKDIARREETRFKIQTVAVGAGIVDWKPIFQAAKAAKIRQYYVEMEPPFQKPILESLKDSYDYVSKLKV